MITFWFELFIYLFTIVLFFIVIFFFYVLNKIEYTVDKIIQY